MDNAKLREILTGLMNDPRAATREWAIAHITLLWEEESEREQCEKCFALEAHFELAEDFTEVAHTFLAGSHGGFCLVCGNHEANPWHQEVGDCTLATRFPGPILGEA